MSAAALIAAAWVFHLYSQDYRVRWASGYHDRVAHYQFGLNMAAEFRNGHLPQLLKDFDAGSLCWPPLHGLALAAVFVVLGPSPVVAVLPSVAAWAASAVLAFALARRLSPRFGTTAGAVAALFVLSGPALRAYAVDVMLESTGLLMTLAAVHAYLLFMESPTRRTGAWLGIALSLLFLGKYNYWGLAVAGLAAGHVLAHGRESVAAVVGVVRAIPWREWGAAQFRRPLNYVIVALASATVYTRMNGGLWVEVGGHTYGMNQPRVVLNVAYALLVARLGVWWWTQGRAAAARLYGEPAATLLGWTVIPPALWLVLPHRLNYLFWYVGPNNSEKTYHSSFADGAAYYASGIAGEYHASTAAAVVAAGLAAVGLLALFRRDRRPGALAVPVVFAVAAALTVLHPNHKMRHVHTWVPLLWVLSGVGAAALARLAGFAGTHAGRPAALATAAVVAVMAAPGLVRPGTATALGFGTPAGSLLDLTDVYPPLIDGRQPTAIFSSRPSPLWTRAAFMERFGHKDNVVSDLRAFGVFDPIPLDAATKWAAMTPCRTVVYLDIPFGSPLYEPIPLPGDNANIRLAVETSPRFRLAHRVEVPDRGTVFVWERAGP